MICFERFKGIEAFLFDLGGVIIDIHPCRAIDSFRRLGFTGIEGQIAQSHHDGLFKALERGEMDERAFIEGLMLNSGAAVSEQAVLEAWHSILGAFPLSRVRILEELHQHFPTYLLSNTNSIHQRAFTRMAKGYEHLEDLFTDVYYSYRLGCSKPEAGVYRKVIQMSGINPETTLFLDDSELNLSAARAFGFQTRLVSPEHSLEDIFL